MSETITASACDLVQRLIDAGQTPTSIAELLDHRVSARTVYRWSRGETVPQNTRTLEALQSIASKHAPVRV